MKKTDTRLRLLRRVAGAALILGAAGPAFAAGDPDIGAAIASHWCSGCHTDDTVSRATDAAPTLQSIARERGEQQAWMRGWLGSPHPLMPNMNLSRAEIDDIIAYLSTLKNH